MDVGLQTSRTVREQMCSVLSHQACGDSVEQQLEVCSSQGHPRKRNWHSQVTTVSGPLRVPRRLTSAVPAIGSGEGWGWRAAGPGAGPCKPCKDTGWQSGGTGSVVNAGLCSWAPSALRG